MNNWYNSLSSRERAIVTYGSVVVSLVLLWLLAIKPLYQKQIKLEKVITQQKSTIATMQKQSIEIKQLQQGAKKPKKASSQNPQQLIERSLQTWRLKTSLERMQAQGNNGVRLSLKNANADRVMRFLNEVEQKHGLSISNMSVESAKKEVGLADFRLTIKRS